MNFENKNQMNIPKARSENIVVQIMDKEILIYDLVLNKAFCLNETSAIVYQACNDMTTFEELKSRHSLNDEIIFLALDELRRQNLLADNIHHESPFTGMTRREIIRQVGSTSMIALPLISSVVAPLAIQAQSQPQSSGCAAPGTLAPTFCGQTDTTCDLNQSNFGVVCCSAMGVTVAQPCPLLPTFVGACACA